MHKNGPHLSRRQWFAALAVIAAPTTVTAAGLHLTGTLTPNDTGDEGYWAICSASGKCDLDDTLVVSVHPKSPLSPHLRAMQGQPVQLSIFPTK